MPSVRDETIARIMAAQERLAYVFAFDRSDPLLSANLTMSQLKIMLALALRGGASGQELTSVMGVGLATITGIIDRLVAQDLVVRREDPKDRRVRRLELTPAGREIIDGILTAGAAHQRRLLERVEAEGLATIERAVQLMLDAAEAERAEITRPYSVP
jgi:DNA-binding MarR family transcriptional regulator